ncbi:copper resistance protein NlpE N-terminal domain-containing protein [Prodigiosinella aquatilis]|nr:copper resistance protein NlpE N-terminal domain-containing protein [Prodigiosinella sp. LS101]WJV54995.1 copper resistance protein NlpE N-terminal domain-containing protein [Prodigiosinella sp. LS101]WJV59356.1 copper resistance protein NlpE N-terminal domain-containing protein [Pectobacteriaceae bacterium C111]
MNKLMIRGLLVFVLSVLIGCRSFSPIQEEPLRPMAQNYRGTLSSSDCANIEVSLFLSKDGRFALQKYYQSGEDGLKTTAEYGQWRRTAEKLVLTGFNGEKRYFRPKNSNELEVLDSDGKPLKFRNRHQLIAIDEPRMKAPVIIWQPVTYHTRMVILS